MKKFFSSLKAAPKSSSNAAAQRPTSPPSTTTTVHTPGLKPEFVVPPMPHPCPHDHLALLPTPEGLLIRPHAPGLVPETHVRIQWGKNVHLDEINSPGDYNEDDWSQSVVVYGIIGTMELFECMF
jgi:hypothetical protein